VIFSSQNVAKLQDFALKLWQNPLAMINKSIFTFVFVTLFASFGLAQDFGADAQRTEIKKLEMMIGRWEGSGWMQRGPGAPETFKGGETVQRKLDGLALLVEGRFLDKDGKVGHETLAVIAYDAKEKAYKFKTYLATGAQGLFDLKLIEGGWMWSIEHPGMMTRYTAKFTGDTWLEIGEFSRDGGKTWVKNFEMTLKKVG
jgi:hypothetical protein